MAALGEKRIADLDLSSRLAFVPGDYLSPPPLPQFDLVLFANVLHQESPDRAEKMLALSAKQLNPGGRIAVLDFAINDKQQQMYVVGALFAINMRSIGDTYPFSTIQKWLRVAGLRTIERVDVGRHRFLITGSKDA